ncbi:MAG: copper resistance protein CopC [Candidatus Promineofilum sp.]|nr:copper resistance protein CopC [Promineifilum sp.]
MRERRAKVLLSVWILLSLVVWAGSVVRPALAHGDLVAAEPEPGAQLAESPAEIRLTFSEPVADGSRIVVLGDDFGQVGGLVPQFNPEVPEQVYTPLPPLEPGVYTVQWAATSDDGHEVSGSYSFSVGLVADATRAGGAAAATSAASRPAGTRSGWWLGVVGIVAVGIPLVLLTLRRAGRRRDAG